MSNNRKFNTQLNADKFHQLQQAGMKTVVMSDILRQQNQDLKQAVELTINAQIKQAFQKIQNNIIEVEPNSKDNPTNKPPLEISSYTNENPQKEYSHNLQEQTELQNINTKERIINATLQTYFKRHQQIKNDDKNFLPVMCFFGIVW